MKAMDAKFIFLIVLLVIIVCAFFWYAHRAKSKSSSQIQSERDPYLQQVASDKARIDEFINTTVQQHEQELEKRFVSDAKHLKLKEQLSQFARLNELDKALISVWEEIKQYTELSDRKDSDKWNKLDLKGINNTSEENTNSVEFLYEGQRFNVKEQTQSQTGELKANLSFYEDGDEVFSIDCLVNSKNEENNYICQHISTFKKRGNWPKVLLECYAQLKIEKKKSLNEIKYFRAIEFKSRFEG